VTERESLGAAVSRLQEQLRTGPQLDLVVNLRAGIARSRLPREQGGADTGAQVRLTDEKVERLRSVIDVPDADETVIIGAYQWWKSVHMIRMICGGASLDWLSPVETQTLLRRVATEPQRRHAAWAQVATAVREGCRLVR